MFLFRETACDLRGGGDRVPRTDVLCICRRGFCARPTRQSFVSGPRRRQVSIVHLSSKHYGDLLFFAHIVSHPLIPYLRLTVSLLPLLLL